MAEESFSDWVVGLDTLPRPNTGDKIPIVDVSAGETKAVVLTSLLALPDIGNAYALTLAWNETAAQDRTLQFEVNDGHRTISLSGDLTVQGAVTLNQDLDTEATGVEFGGIENTPIGGTTPSTVTVQNQGLIVVDTVPFNRMASNQLQLLRIAGLDTTTKDTIQAAINSLTYLASIQGQSISFSGTLTVEENAVVDQDLSDDAAVTHGGMTLAGGVLTLAETTTPTAVADYGKIYTKADNKLYFQDGAGTEHEIAFV